MPHHHATYFSLEGQDCHRMQVAYADAANLITILQVNLLFILMRWERHDIMTTHTIMPYSACNNAQIHCDYYCDNQHHPIPDVAVTAAVPPKGTLEEAPDCPNSPAPGLPGRPKAGMGPVDGGKGPEDAAGDAGNGPGDAGKGPEDDVAALC